MSKDYEKVVSKGYEMYVKLKNYRRYASEVKDIVRGFWPDARVYVFGSVLTGRFTAASDIDVLVIIDGEVDMETVYKVKVRVKREVDAPIELHIVNRDTYERWYRRFIDRIEEI